MLEGKERQREEMLEGKERQREEMLEGKERLREEMLEGKERLREEMLEGKERLREMLQTHYRGQRDSMFACYYIHSPHTIVILRTPHIYIIYNYNIYISMSIATYLSPTHTHSLTSDPNQRHQCHQPYQLSQLVRLVAHEKNDSRGVGGYQPCLASQLARPPLKSTPHRYKLCI